LTKQKNKQRNALFHYKGRNTTGWVLRTFADDLVEEADIFEESVFSQMLLYMRRKYT